MFFKKRARIDPWLLDKFQSFSYWWEIRTGKGCFWLAEVSLTLAITHYLVSYLLGLVGFSFYKIGFGALCYMLFVFMLLSISLRREEKTYQELYLKNITNPAKEKFRKMRIYSLLLPMLAIIFFILSARVDKQKMTIFDLINYLVVVWFVPHLYFKSCDFLPPLQSRTS